MLFSRQLAAQPLAELCRRVGIASETGIPVRVVWAREAERGPAWARPALADIAEGVSRGETVSDALAAAPRIFPPLFYEIVEVGEQSGRLAEVFKRLAHHFDQLVRLRRKFRKQIAWPMIQLCLALGVIGLVIFISGILRSVTGNDELDMLGLGLVGVPGLIIYLMAVGTAVVGGLIFWKAVREGLLWAKPLQYFIWRLPIVGPPLRTLALSRMAWSLEATLDAGVDTRKALALALRSTHFAPLVDTADDVLADISRGDEIYEALARTGAFPQDFLDAVAVGEQSGRLPESMGVLSRNYQEQAEAAIAVLSTIGGWIVYGMVALFIISAILRIAGFYGGVINELAKPGGGL
ncbi:MAG: type II secretion system F family protein [Pirellulales bacterium]